MLQQIEMAPAAALAGADAEEWTSYDNSSVALKVICKGQQYASTHDAHKLVAVRGMGAFTCEDARIAAHMDQGLLTDPDAPQGDPVRLPWDKMQLRHLVLFKCERTVTPTAEEAAAVAMPIEPVKVTQYQAFWRRCVLGDLKHDDLYGLRTLRLVALKAIFKGLELDEQSPDRKTYLTYNLSSAEILIWQEFSVLAKANKFASGLSVNLVEYLREQEENNPSGTTPFKLRMQVEPGWSSTRSRNEFDSAVVPIRRPKAAKTAVVEVPTSETLVRPPPHVMPILHGGAMCGAVTLLYDMPESASIHSSENMLIVTAPTSSLKRARADDPPAPDSLIPAKELRAFKKRVDIKHVDGDVTFFTFSGLSGDEFKIEARKGVPGSYVVFHGANPPPLGGGGAAAAAPSALGEGSQFEPEDIDDVVA